MTPETQAWQARADPAWLAHNWNPAIVRPHYRQILAALEWLQPWSSLVDLGCNVGACLRAIQDRWPAARLGGLDVNQHAIRAAQAHAAARRWPWKLWCGDILHDRARLRGEHIDIFLSSYMLAYVQPDAVGELLMWMEGRVRRGLVIAEPMADDDGVDSLPLAPAMSQVPGWRHHYDRLWAAESLALPVVPAVDGLNWVLGVKRPAVV